MTQIDLDGPGIVKVSGLPDWQGWRFRVVLTDYTGPDAQAVEVIAPKGQAVKPDRWRALPIGKVIRLAASAQSVPVLTAVVADHDIEPGRRPYGGGIEFLRQVAEVYRLALSQGLTLVAVAEVYGVTNKTAREWFREARKTIDPDTGKPVLGTHEEERKRYGLTDRERQQARDHDRKRAESTKAPEPRSGKRQSRRTSSN